MKPRGSLTIALVLATPGSGWGGMEKHTTDLAEALSTQGHNVHVLTHSAYGERFAAGVVVHTLPVQLGRRNPWLRFCVTKLLRSIEPDIIHAQGNKAASLVGTIARKSWVTVGTLHGTKRSHKAFDRLDGVIGVSRDITDALAHPNTRLIHNGLRPAQTSSDASTGATATPIPDDRPLLLAAGRLESVKQFDRLIRAWARTDCSGKLVILGEGSQRNRLYALIRELNAEDRILLPGHESQVPRWLKSATACVISSKREGFPYIMVEALVAGCPVLSTPVSGVSEFLPENCIAESDDVEDISTLIRSSLSDPVALRESMSTCFHKAREQLSLETMAMKTEAFYRELRASVPKGR